MLRCSRSSRWIARSGMKVEEQFRKEQAALQQTERRIDEAIEVMNICVFLKVDEVTAVFVPVFIFFLF